jgi:hypothetical protein
MKYLILLLLCWLFAFATPVLAQTSLVGTVTDDIGEPIIFGTIRLSQGGQLVTGSQTDFDGKYQIVPLEPGIYDVQFDYIGYDTTYMEGVLVEEGVANQLDIQISNGVTLEAVNIIGPSCFPQPEQVMAANIVSPGDLIRMLEAPYYITLYEKGVIVGVNEEVRDLELWMEDELIAKWRKRKPGEYKVKVGDLPAGQVLKLISGSNDFECQAVY